MECVVEGIGSTAVGRVGLWGVDCSAPRIYSGITASNLPPVEIRSRVNEECSSELSASSILLGLTLITLQILDGVLTGIGVSRFGLDIEGNPFLRHTMEEFGHVNTLAFAKLMAICIVIFLMYGTKKIGWLKQALAGVSLVYLFMAIIPWTYLLFVRDYLA